MAGPDVPPLRSPARWLRSNSPSTRLPPWHLTQLFTSTGRTCFLKVSSPFIIFAAWSGSRGGLSAGFGSASSAVQDQATQKRASAKIPIMAECFFMGGTRRLVEEHSVGGQGTRDRITARRAGVQIMAE